MSIGSSLGEWLVVIPARLASERLPRKPLQDLGGKPLIVRVRENLLPLERSGARVVVATDHEDIVKACAQFGYEAVLTKSSHPSGTDRCHEVASRFEYPFILNVQGDEPFVHIGDLMALMTAMKARPEIPMGSLVYDSGDLSDYTSPNVVKAVRSNEGVAIYFSRSPIPYDRDTRNGDIGLCRFWQHLGVYGFRREALQKFCAMPPGLLEKREKLEQLRVVEAGWKIWLEPASRASLGIDTPQDLEAARATIKAK